MKALFEVAHRTKMGILRLKDVYYADKIRRNDPGYDAVYYFCCREPTENSKKYLTTAVNLSMDEGDLLASFRKSTRQDIKRIINDENANIATILAPEEDQIISFIRTYNQFTRKKGFYPADQHRIDTLHKAGRIVLLKATYDKELILEQMMMEDEHKAVALYGYTIRLDESDAGKLRLISSISKMVDYHCMLYWKKRNKQYYDLGGLIMEPANPSGDNINQYKAGFRGDLLVEYEFIYPLTWKGKVFCWLKEGLRMIKGMAHRAATKRNNAVAGGGWLVP